MNLPISPTPIAEQPFLNGGAMVGVVDENETLAEVFVYIGLDFAAKYAIAHGEYLLGRDVSCHIPLDTEGVSRHHARLSFGSYELVIEDLSSSNGIFIDGVQVKLPTPLRPDQEVQIGNARITVRLTDSAARQFAAALWDADLGLSPIREQLTGSRYKILTTVARGGMGLILQARDLRVRRTVAMKVMKAGAQFSRENVLRFIDEAQVTGQLEHPNIVPVYELGIDEHGQTFYTMKFVKGITLDEILRGLRSGRAEIMNKYPLGVLLTIFQKVCDAVAFAHAKGVVHRDLKPENIMVGSYGEVLVMDWGLAKHRSSLRPDATATTERPAVIPQVPAVHHGRGFETMHGVVVGTPPYVSPEQARGELEQIDSRSDIYVLGGILYAILTLRAPVGGLNVNEILEKIVAGDITPPTHFNIQNAARNGEDFVPLVHCPGARVPEGLAAVAMKALHTEPAERYQALEEMQSDVAAYIGGFAPKAERATPMRQLLLFAGRHRREFILMIVFAVILQGLLVGFVIQLTTEKNRAQASELRAIESEQRTRGSESDLAKALAELRGTAPTFAQEAATLLEQQREEEALDKIDYAIEQVPNEAGYHALRGNILQTMLRFADASGAYREALARNPRHAGAGDNLKITEQLAAGIGEDGQVTPAMLRSLHAELMKQNRVPEALTVLEQMGRDKKLFFETWRAALDKRGLRQRFETKEDDTLFVDLSKVNHPDLRKLRGAPVSGISLDDTRLTDISALRGLPLTRLSFNRTAIRDIAPLIGMPLQTLSMDGTGVLNLRPLAGMPLEVLRLSGTKVEDLSALRGLRLEQLSMGNCRNVRDLLPLTGMPLQNVDLSRTSVTDLTPLTRSPIRELNLEGCLNLVNLRPLMDIPTLEGLLLPAQAKDVEFLREHPALKRLSYKKMTQPVQTFWAEFDRKK